MASNYKLMIDQGSTLTRTITLKYSSGVAYDLTGATFAGQIRKSATNPAKITDLTLTVTSPATNGQLTLSLTDTQTAALPVDSNPGPERVSTLYCYDVEMTKGGVITRVLQGEVLVSPEVTR